MNTRDLQIGAVVLLSVGIQFPITVLLAKFRARIMLAQRRLNNSTAALEGNRPRRAAWISRELVASWALWCTAMFLTLANLYGIMAFVFVRYQGPITHPARDIMKVGYMFLLWMLPWLATALWRVHVEERRLGELKQADSEA
jgi:hypothetical protein